MDVVIYSRRDCSESAVVRDYLARMGVDFRELAVDGDAAARTAWEDLDGQVTPVISRTYGFAELREAVAYQEQGHVPAKLAVTV